MKKYNTLITSGQAEFTIIGLSATEYGDYRPRRSRLHSAGLLRGAVRQTILPWHKPTFRPVTGVQFEIAEDSVRLVAVDGSRLAMRCEPIPERTATFGAGQNPQ